jgi:HK97 family phage major capsid protein
MPNPLKNMAPQDQLRADKALPLLARKYRLDLPGEGGSDSDTNELLDIRNKAMKLADAIVYGGGDSDLSENEQLAFDSLMNMVDNCNHWITQRKQIEGKSHTPLSDSNYANPRHGSADRDGIVVLSSSERLADRTGGHVERGVLANIIRSQVGLEPLEGSGGMNAASSITPATSGGHTVPTPLAAQIIDLSRAESRVMQAGARLVPMTATTLKFARVEEDVQGHWRAENAEIPESEMAFSGLTLEAKALAALTRVSVELMEDAANFEEALMTSLAQALALELDRVALFGSGANDEPLGIFNAAGISTVDVNAAIASYGPLSEAVEKVANANETAGGFILSPRTEGQLDRLTDANGQPLQPPRSVSERRMLATNQVPNNLGTGTNESAIFTGYWPSLLVGMRTSMVIEASRVAGGDAFRKMQVMVRAYLRADIQLARPSHFAVIRGLLPDAPA